MRIMVRTRGHRLGTRDLLYSFGATLPTIKSVRQLYGNPKDLVMRLPDGTERSVEFLTMLKLTVQPDQNIEDILEQTFGGRNIGFLSEQIGETNTYKVHVYNIR